MNLKCLNSRLFLAAVTLLAGPAALAHGISAEARQRMIDGGNIEYLRLGAEHMITGYDHLLFLFGVMFFLKRMMDIVKFVSAFTIGHTITLVLATYMQISANYYLVDAFIAVTVAYKGFENLDGFRKYLNVKSPDLLAMVLFFGLIHGFGLSTRLQQLPVDEGGGMLAHILSFNVGVEIGQIMALVVMWGILHIWQHREHFPVISKIANGGLIAAGCLLLVMQLHGYTHTMHTDSFPISRDDHAHVHADMQSHGHAHNPDGSHIQEGAAPELPGNVPSHE
jgi:hypothetical protein